MGRAVTQYAGMPGALDILNISRDEAATTSLGLPVPHQLHASHHDQLNVGNSFQMSNVNLSFSLLPFIFDLLFRNDVRSQSPTFLFEQDHG